MRIASSTNDYALGFPATFDAGDGARARYNTIGARTPVFPRPSASDRALGLICTGQSTMAGWSSGALYTATQAKSLQGNIYDGRVYAMADPVFGCDQQTPSGIGGSPSSAIGDYLIANGKYDRVCVVNVAFGSTRSSQWANGTNNLALGVKAAWALLIAHGYTNIKIAHQQGEGDAADGTSTATMLANNTAFNTWCMAVGINCPMLIAQTTFPYGGWVLTDPNPVLWTPGAAAIAVRNAQAACWGLGTMAKGPDTDLVRGLQFGRGSAHPTDQAGPLAMAQAWAALL